VSGFALARQALHSLVLTGADVAGIALGALAAFRILGTANKVALQLPIAVVMSVGLFCAWMLLVRILRFRGLRFQGAREPGVCLVLSLLWAPLVFVPLHFFTQGYLTSTGNLVALAIYQLPVNAFALFGPWTPRKAGA
jgi:hypothetical protein